MRRLQINSIRMKAILGSVLALSLMVSLTSGCALFGDGYPDPRQSQAGGGTLESQKSGEMTPWLVAAGTLLLAITAGLIAASIDSSD